MSRPKFEVSCAFQVMFRLPVRVERCAKKCAHAVFHFLILLLSLFDNVPLSAH